MKTASIVAILATSRLLKQFCSGHNVPRFARGDFTSSLTKIYFDLTNC